VKIVPTKPKKEEQFFSTANVIIQNDNHRRLKSLQLPINSYSFKPKKCYNLKAFNVIYYMLGGELSIQTSK